MHPRAIAEVHPERPAVVLGTSGATTTFAQLDERSNRIAHLFRACGLGPGSTVAIFAENHPAYLEVAWAAQRSGLYYTAVNSHLTAEEAAFIVDDCGAELLVSSTHLAGVAASLDAEATPRVRHRFLLQSDDATPGTVPEGWALLDDATADQPHGPIADEAEGDFMLYSSGTTGRPKGIRRPLSLAPLGQGLPGARPFLQMLGFGDADVYLSPAPLYHAAPLAWSMAAHRLGGTSVIMERFDAEVCLRLIEQHRVTHAQFVPTMFVRLLKLPDDVRARADVSSLRRVVHAAAPCAVEVKRAMLEWWGPIIDEFYSCTEGVGFTFISAEDWLAHPGSVGQALMGEPHVLDDEGRELPAGEVGTIWFGGGSDFAYHGDPAKTAAARNDQGWATVGDVGFLDADGYLYLTDRKAFTIISGGVNIYPREAEDVLITHPAVYDVAVLGVPHPEWGEEVKAVVQPVDPAAAGDEVGEELLAYCRERLSAYKCPRSVDFVEELPRLDTGKLYKRALRDRYWAPEGS